MSALPSMQKRSGVPPSGQADVQMQLIWRLSLQSASLHARLCLGICRTRLLRKPLASKRQQYPQGLDEGSSSTSSMMGTCSLSRDLGACITSALHKAVRNVGCCLLPLVYD